MMASRATSPIFVPPPPSEPRNVIYSGSTMVTHVAGSSKSGCADNENGLMADLNYPYDIVFDREGTGYFTDFGNSRIRTISPSKKISTLTAKAFATPRGLTMDIDGNLIVADCGSHTIRKVKLPSGEVTLVAGTPGLSGRTNGNISEAQFAYPYSVCCDKKGNIFVADTANNCIRKISADGMVTTFVGSGVCKTEDGLLAESSFASPYGICIDDDGTLYVADHGGGIRKVTENGEVTTLAGRMYGNHVDGHPDFSCFRGLYRVSILKRMAVSGNSLVPSLTTYLLLCDYSDNSIRELNLETNFVSTLAGIPGKRGHVPKGSGPPVTGSAAKFELPTGLGVCPVSNIIYVMDCYNHAIKTIMFPSSLASQWPQAHFHLPIQCQEAIITLLCVMEKFGISHGGGEIYFPQELTHIVVWYLVYLWPL